MITLTKKTAAQWNGNGFGSSTAEWTVKGYENITVKQSGLYWVATDNAYGMDRRMVRGDTKKDVVEQLNKYLSSI